eukprot:COSAG01_NODE_2045_length_8561_cov_6.449421_1_plen_35_part_00
MRNIRNILVGTLFLQAFGWETIEPLKIAWVGLIE